MVPLEFYSREERIGRGSFGEVYVGTDSRSSEVRVRLQTRLYVEALLF